MTRRDLYLNPGGTKGDPHGPRIEKYPPPTGWIIAAIFAVLGLLGACLLSGCAAPLTVTETDGLRVEADGRGKVSITDITGVYGGPTRYVTAARPHKVRPLPRANVRHSGPVEVRQYSRPVETDLPTLEIYEVQMDGEYATFYALDKAIKVMLPARGEETTVRFTDGQYAWPDAEIITKGAPEPETAVVPRVSGRRGFGIGRTIRWIGYGAVAVAVIYLLSMVRAALKDARRERQQDKMQNAFWMSLMGQFRGKK